MKRSLWLRVAALAAAGLVQAAPVAAQAGAPAVAAPVTAPPDRAQVEERLDLVATLLESSSAARQVEASGDARAQERRRKARELHGAAAAALREGDLAGSLRLLQSATATMFEAVRFAAPEQVTADKRQKDFDARMESARALLGAHKRISVEKSNAQGAETTRSIEKLLQEAAGLAAAGKLDQGRAVLDRAYLVAKAAIGSMRSGDTLVRSLKFASKEEEYRYELDRNETHQMLVRVLVDEKRGAADLDAMVAGFMDKAHELRRQAEAEAARGEFEAGIRALEASTAELVRAIRAAGIYIPG